jgi:uncharacterized protein
MAKRDTVIVLTRYPAPGTTKTRMIPSLGEDGAARLQRRMTLKTLAECSPNVLNAHAVHDAHAAHAAVEIRYASHDAHDGHESHDCDDELLMKRWLGASRTYIPQADGDLGARMANAFSEAFLNGSERVVIIGTDCPGLNAGHLHAAFEKLDTCDMVLGPAHDGGYYLIGLGKKARHAAVPGLFEHIGWGTADVFAETVKKAGSLGLSHDILDILHDVDRPEDLPVWERTQKKLSVIIPTLNEKDTIGRTLEHAGRGSNIEIITVDGGSTDGTRELIEAQGIACITGAKGRGSQMNLGFAHSTGEIILFLHADTILPEDYDVIARAALDAEDIVCGAFTLGIDSPWKALRIIEATTHFRAKYMQMPYGDQALFMRRQTFVESGGFPDMPVMEDFEFVRRLGRVGKIGIVPFRVLTSGRRWERRGIMRTTLINQCMIAGYYLGIPSDTLARLYYGKNRKQ